MTDSPPPKALLPSLTSQDAQASFYSDLKRHWYAKEESTRKAIGKPMVKFIEPWQLWHVDPEGVPWWQRGLDVAMETYAKLNMAENDILKKLTFRPALIVSSHEVNSGGRAWVCRRNTPEHPLSAPWAVPVGAYRGKSSYIIIPHLRCLSADTNGELATRELLAFGRNLDERYRPLVRRMLHLLVEDGLVSDPDAPPPGSLVSVTDADGPFNGLVVGSCRVFKSNTRFAIYNRVIVCRLRAFRDWHEDMEGDGILVFRSGVSGYPDVPVSMDVCLLRSVLRSQVHEIGSAAGYLPKVRRLLRARLAPA